MIILPANTLSGGYEVANSCRFNDDDSAYLSKTLGSNGNQKTFTWSAWIKRGNMGASQFLFDVHASGAHHSHIYISSGNAVGVYNANGNHSFSTNNLLRDPTAWYHLVWRVDTTQSSNSDRVRIYINGTEASYASYSTIAQNTNFEINGNGSACSIGRRNAGDYFDGYMAEIFFCDGQSYAPTVFGEFDADSPTIWKPKDCKADLTFGTHGYYFPFDDSSDLGDDESGNTNDFTENNLAATDQSSDSPTNNFATFNPLVKGNVATTLSEGNLKGVFGSGWSWLPATFGVQNGKWYWEAKVSATNDANVFIGITTEDQDWDDATPYDETGTILYFADGRKSVDGTDTESHFASYTTNDIIGVALDLDSGTRTITFYKNNSVTPASSSAVTITSNFDNKFIMPVFVGNSSSAAANWELNFGNPPYANTSDAADANGYGAFEYAPPSGYYALCTKNLAEFG